ncbi:MAG: hypothetical protein GY855_13890, partial [candidate division Zixibacteria bacterium]|nr:hypothetical protein [candidate division Zixibacteria bacterium]
MNSKRLFLNRVAITGIFVLLFLNGCSSPLPPGINLFTPEGQVIDLSVSSNYVQTIEGKVVKGTNPIKGLYVGDEEIAIDRLGYFSYDFELTDPQDDLFSICTFEIIDTLNVSWKERITFINGESVDNIGMPEQYDPLFLRNAVNVVLNEDMINVGAQAAVRMINNHLQELIEASELLPMVFFGDNSAIPTVTITDVSINGLTLGYVDVRENDIIAADGLDIDHMYVAGTMDWGILGGLNDFTMDIVGVSIDSLPMEIFVDEKDNDIDVRINLTQLGADFFRPFYVAMTYNGAPTTLGSLIKWGAQFALKYFIKTMRIPLMDMNDMAFNFTTDMLGFKDNTIFGIPLSHIPLGIEAWFPEGYVYYTDEYDEMYMHLGMAINPINDPDVNQYAVPSPNPIGHYYSTPNDDLPAPNYPELCLLGNNITIGLNDDLINMGAWAAMEAGAFDGLDITTLFKRLTGKTLANTLLKKAIAKIYMKTPPIADFSGPGNGSYTQTYPDQDGVISNAGIFRVRNMIIEVTDLLADKIVDKALISVDADMEIKLKISNDFKHIEGFMGEQSMMAIKQLYYGSIELTDLANVAPEITNYIADLAVRSLIKVDLPVIALYDANIQPAVHSIEVGNNNMIVR